MTARSKLQRLPPALRRWGFAASLFLTALLLLGLLPAQAQTVLQDGFESGAFDAAWDLTAGTAITNTGGAIGTTRFAAVATNIGNFGARFSDVASSGANDFYVDFFFRVKSSANRQFNMQISDSSAAIGNGAATVNLRYQAGWAAYNSAWQPISSLGAVTAGQWHHLRLTGTNWGKAGASFSLQLSDAGGTSFTSIATNLNVFQNGNPSNNTARYFVFTTGFGNCPGFDVDEVTSVVTAAPVGETNAIINVSGTYPHLTVFSAEGEIGMGALVPWADRLWFVTYPPHAPTGSADKLWMVESNLTMTANTNSVGGTHANRMIHRETQQLNIGPYFITTKGTVRVISPSIMPGRLTATARHLTDPTNKLYIATMEEGLYEVDVNTLVPTELYHDMNTTPGVGQRASGLPGAHGKGAYSAQGRLVFANNGTGGDLASWDGTNWSNVQVAKHTEVTGPGGIYGNTPDDDRLWSLGWDTRSVMLKLLQDGVWRTYRLPKASYTHDADHGWYTEWPRIREVQPNKLLMHMHGMFYYFPKTFAAANTAGLQPICTYLKMPVDYCWFNGQLVMGRDDTSTTGGNIWAGQSHSAPWFGQLSDLEQWGAPAGFGGVWLNDTVTASTPSDPLFVSGFKKRILHLKHSTAQAVNFALQIDASGTGTWTTLTNIAVPANGYAWFLLPSTLTAPWVRLVPAGNATGVTAYFHFANPPTAPTPALFTGLADATPAACSDGIIRPQSGDAHTLQFAASFLDGTGAQSGTGYYEITGAMLLRRATNATAEATLRSTYSLSNANFTVDGASVIYTEGANRFRLPKNSTNYDAAFASGWPRGAREVVTERQLFNAHGTFYELPYSDSGGFRRVRPVTTHNKHISDFASWRGMFAIAGLATSATNNGHVFRADDGQAALWFGNVDDLWRMGAPAGVGGPWKNSAVAANTASDPYLMFGYDRKVLEMSHAAANAVTLIVEVDVAADNTWSEYARFTVPAGQTVRHVFPTGYSAHWVRLKTDTATTATATFTYSAAVPQITGQVELEGYVGPNLDGRGTRDVVFTATDSASAILGTWTNTLTFAPGPGGFGVADYTLDNVPAATSYLSAKTAWNLRRRLPVSFTDNQAVAIFTENSLLPGGDIFGGNNLVDIEDYFRLAGAWFQPDAAADIDGSGLVDLTDFSILASRWYEVGDAP